MRSKCRWNNLVIFLSLPLLWIFVSCGTGTGSAGGAQEYDTMVEQVKELNFEVENIWANPLRGERISLQGNNNYLRIEGDQAEIFLPYFGVRHSGGGYGAEGAIKYEGPMENLQIKENPRKEEIEVYFSGDHKTENFDFHITIYPNGKTTTSVATSQRDRIVYDGRIQEK